MSTVGGSIVNTKPSNFSDFFTFSSVTLSTLLESPRKPQKWKEGKILHRCYVQKNISVPKKYIFSRSSFFFRKFFGFFIFVEIFSQKVAKIDFRKFRFSIKKFHFFFKKKNRKFSRSKKKYFFSDLIFFGHSFDAEFSPLSISEVFEVIWATWGYLQAEKGHG